MAASPCICVVVFLMGMVVVNEATQIVGTASWCVARSDASNTALQNGLDYACGFGADCSPIQSNGLCYLPNTMLNHASYAYNSYFQRQNMAPGSCDFSGSATVAKTDPSFGACIFPSSLSTAGGPPTQTSPSTQLPPNTPPSMSGNGTPYIGGGGAGTPYIGGGGGAGTPYIGGGGGTGVLPPPGFSGPTTSTTNSEASLGSPVTTILMTISFFIVLSLTFDPTMLVI